MISSSYQLSGVFRFSLLIVFTFLFNVSSSYAQAPSITTHPANGNVCAGSNTTFTIVASNATSYQWQVSSNGGSTWNNISNTGIYSGATTASISLTSISSTYNNYRYRCVATGSTSPAATSNSATLTVTALPTISSTTGGTVCASSSGQVSAIASTGATVTWHTASTGGSSLGTGNTLTIPSATTTTTYYAGASIGGTGNSDTVQTPYNTNNGQRGAMFDIVTNTAMTVTGFDVSLYSGTTADYYIYYKVGTHVGFETNSAAWIPLDTVTGITSAGNNIPTPMGFNIAVPLQANTRYSFYITNDFGGGTSYTDGTAVGNYWAGNSDVTFYEGVGKSFPFGLTFTVRKINATMHYTTAIGCVSSTRTGATLTVNPQANITANPPNRSITSGSNTTFSITAASATNYQWQVSTNSGSTWSNITNTGIYSGATTNTLSLTSATATYNNYQYRCIASNSGSCSDTSTGGILSITGTAPSISTQPVNRIICAGGNTTFGVSASGTSISYQWQVSTNSGSTWNNIANTGIYSGATTNTLSLTAATATYNAYQYRCIVTGSINPAATSNAATLTINVIPSITVQPSNSIICNGNNTSFSITTSNATGYQWQVSTNSGSTWNSVSNTGIYSGATTNTLSLTAATATYNSYRYRCIVTGSCTPNATSNTATLTINSAPTITVQPSNSTIGTGSNTSFSVTASSATNYQWQVSTNNGSTWNSVSNTGIYSGATTNTLSLTAATATYNSYQYRCVITGACTPNATSNAVTLTVNSAPAITAQPANTTICSGGNTSFSVTATNATGYQWQVNTGSGWNNLTNTGIYSGATTNTLSLTAATLTYNSYQYRCEVTGATTPNAISNAAILTINIAPSITLQPTNSTVCETTNTSFSINATNATNYQWQVNTGSTWTNVTNTGVYSNATTNTLNLTGVASTMNTYQYRCIATGTCTPAETSNTATLNINTAPLITAQPSNSTICTGTNTSFSITATGTSLTYQWQVNTGSSWSNVTNTGIYTGATTNTLALTAATSAVNSYQYRCIVSGTCTPNETSNAATITINTSPTITTQPVNTNVCSGGNTSINVVATGAGLTYQWQVYNGTTWANLTNSGIYSNVTTASLSLTGATSGNVSGYQYRCIVNGTCTPNITSNSATLSINSILTINSQPANSTICAGTNTSFGVTASGTGLTYQWQVNTGSGWNNVTNAGIYTGATTNTLNLTAATNAINGNQYRCVLSSTCTSQANSNVATLTINTPPTIITQPTNSTICDGTNTSFTIAATGTALIYQWQVNTGSGWNNVINTGIYTGATTNKLNLTAATNAINGNQYRCLVGGTCTPSTTSNAATLTIETAPTITTHPTNTTTCDGSNATFAVSATGAGLTYQWQVNTGSGWNNVTNTGVYTGATASTLNLTAATSAVSGNQYRCIISGTCTPNATSNAATITINSTLTINTQPANTTICSGNNTSFTISANASGLTYQWQVNMGSGWNNVTNTGIYSGATTNTLNLTAATVAINGNQYRCVLNSICTAPANSNVATLTINVAPTITTQPTNSTICSGNNTSFSVTASGSGITYQWQVNTGSGWNNVTNTGIYSGATTSTLNLTAATNTVSGNQYRCVIGGSCVPGVNSNSVTLTVNDLPTISTQPINSTICSGSSTSFTITASGTGITYQWQVNSGSGWNNVANTGIYTGATSNTLNLTAATTTINTYQYRCVVGGTCSPNATSNAATITVNAAPSVSLQPTNTTICEGNNTSFSTTATGTGVTYQWQVNTGSGWGNVTNGGVYSNATTSTLNLTNPPASYSTNQYRCAIGGTCIPGINTNAVTLTVNTLPSINTQPSNSTICSGSNTTFNITAIGTGITYQWQVNSGSGWGNVTNTGIYTGATTNTLNLTSATTTINGNQYRCIVNGICTPSVTSNSASITINSAPSITAQPNNSTLCEYGVTSFGITATGTSLTYQWQVNTGSGWNNVVNGGFYTNATTNTLTITAVTSSLNGNQYRCIVGGTCIPGVNSNAATLTVNTAPAIALQPNTVVICSGDNTSYTVETTGTNLNYQWQVNTGSGWNNLTNTGIYSGTTNDTLNLTAVSNTINGNQYRCVVTGACTPSVTSNTVGITVNTAPSISNQPINRTICEGGNTTFNITASGTNLTYQWQVNSGSGWSNVTNTGIYTGTTTNTLNLASATTAVHNNQYRCVLGGTCLPSITSSTATLTINTAPVIVTNPLNKTICDGNNTTFSVAATGTSLIYQWQANDGTGWTNIANGGIYSGATAATLNLTAANTSYNNYNYRCIVSGSCTPSVITAIAVLTINSLPTVSTQPTNKTICVGSNTTFTAMGSGTGITYQWQVNTGSGWNNIANTGFYSNATTGTLNITNATTAISGHQYRCVMSGTCPPAVNTNAVTLTVNTLPNITSNPSNSVICDGNNTSFSINATGTAIAYQWQVNTGSGWNNITNGGVYSNATTATLNLTAPNTTYNSYQYRCIVNGYCSPAATSTAANLTVHPIVTPTVNITSTATTICAGTSVTFSVNSFSNGGTNPSYQWKRNGSNVGTNSTSYTTSSLSNNDVITCVMTTTAPCPTSPTATSNAITMTVNPLLLPVINIASATGDSVCETRLATFTASIVNGGSAPIYQWKLNGVNVGTNSDTFKTSTLNNGDVITCQLTSNALCATPKVVISSGIKMKVIPLSFATAKIQATPNDTICQDDQVIVYCYYTDGGPNPTFDWFVNGNKIQNSFGSYTSTQFTNGDTVHCIFTNGNVCPEPVTTNKEIITVNQNQTSSLSIIASSGNVIAPGWTVTFTAVPTNPGTNPTYAWRKNGQFITGITGHTYTDSDLKFGDKIDAVLKADWPCKVNEYAISNTLIVNIPASANNITNSGYSLTLFPNPNRGTFMLRGAFGIANKSARISVINSLGQKVFVDQTELNSGELNYQLRMPSSTATGMYMITIEVDGQAYHKRFNIIE